MVPGRYARGSALEGWRYSSHQPMGLMEVGHHVNILSPGNQILSILLRYEVSPARPCSAVCARFRKIAGLGRPLREWAQACEGHDVCCLPTGGGHSPERLTAGSQGHRLQRGPANNNTVISFLDPQYLYRVLQNKPTSIGRKKPYTRDSRIEHNPLHYM